MNSICTCHACQGREKNWPLRGERQRGPLEARLRTARDARALLLETLGEEAEEKAKEVCGALDVEISQLHDNLQRVTIDSRVEALAKREASERARQRRLERTLASLSDQLAMPGYRMS